MTESTVFNFKIPSGLIKGSKNKTNEAEVDLMKRLIQFHKLVTSNTPTKF